MPFNTTRIVSLAHTCGRGRVLNRAEFTRIQVFRIESSSSCAPHGPGATIIRGRDESNNNSLRNDPRIAGITSPDYGKKTP